MIEDYYSETIILLDDPAASTSPFSTSTGSYTTAASIPAAVNLLSGDEREAYGKLGFDAQYKAYSDVSTEVYAGRRCTWDGDSFVIVDVPKNTLQKGHHLRFLLRDVGDA